MKVVAANFTVLRESIDWIASEHLRVNKEIQDEYMASKEDL